MSQSSIKKKTLPCILFSDQIQISVMSLEVSPSKPFKADCDILTAMVLFLQFSRIGMFFECHALPNLYTALLLHRNYSL